MRPQHLCRAPTALFSSCLLHCLLTKSDRYRRDPLLSEPIRTSAYLRKTSRVTCRACVTPLPCHRCFTNSHPDPTSGNPTPRVYLVSHAGSTPDVSRVTPPRSRNPRPPNPTTHESTRVTRQIYQTCHASHVPTHVSRPNGSVAGWHTTPSACTNTTLLHRCTKYVPCVLLTHSAFSMRICTSHQTW